MVQSDQTTSTAQAVRLCELKGRQSNPSELEIALPDGELIDDAGALTSELRFRTRAQPTEWR